MFKYPIRQSTMTMTECKQVGLASWSKCPLSLLRVVGWIPLPWQLLKAIGGIYAAPVRLCMIDGTQTGKSL